MVVFLRTFFDLFFLGLSLLVVARVLMTYVDPMGRNQVSWFLIQTTEPILGPVRRVLPSNGMIDFSPLIVIVILGALSRAF